MNKKKPPRLWLRTGRSSYWVILDGARRVATGCGAGERKAAERKLAEYLIADHLNERDGEHLSQRGWLMDLIGRDLIGEVEQLQARVAALEEALKRTYKRKTVERL